MLRKKLRNKTILMRTAALGGRNDWSSGFADEGELTLCWPLLGRRVLYISMINDAMMAENKVVCKSIERDRSQNTKGAINLVSYEENHRTRIIPPALYVCLVVNLCFRPIQLPKCGRWVTVFRDFDSPESERVTLSQIKVYHCEPFPHVGSQSPNPGTTIVSNAGLGCAE
jgi:hypothetical protein